MQKNSATKERIVSQGIFKTKTGYRLRLTDSKTGEYESHKFLSLDQAEIFRDKWKADRNIKPKAFQTMGVIKLPTFEKKITQTVHCKHCTEIIAINYTDGSSVPYPCACTERKLEERRKENGIRKPSQPF